MGQWKLYGLAFAIITTLIIGGLLQSTHFCSMALFGVLVYFYYSDKTADGLKCMCINAALALLGFILLIYCPPSIVLKSLFLAIIALLTMYTAKRLCPNPMGPFFVIMIVSLGGTMHTQASDKLLQLFYLASGMAISIVAAYLTQQIEQRLSHAHQVLSENAPSMPTQQARILSITYGATLFLTYLLNLLFPYHTYNWLTVSAAANLKESKAKLALKRYGWYILGNLAGIVFIWLIYQISNSALLLLPLSAVLFLMTAIVININYGLALSCATPLAMILLDILHPVAINKLIIIRLTSIIIGSLIGLCASILIDKQLNRITVANNSH